MSVLELETITDEVIESVASEQHHFYCCDPNIALCGLDISDQPFDESFDENDPDMCAACVLLDKLPCEVCGE